MLARDVNSPTNRAAVFVLAECEMNASRHSHTTTRMIPSGKQAITEVSYIPNSSNFRVIPVGISVVNNTPWDIFMLDLSERRHR
jgi:hypothetical protein